MLAEKVTLAVLRTEVLYNKLCLRRANVQAHDQSPKEALMSRILSQTISIYALTDPITGDVKYVGQTVQPLELRLACHIDKALKRRESTRKAQWIASLLEKGTKPKIVLLERTDKGNKKQAEQKWIDFYSQRSELMNIAPAGAGGSYNQKVRWSPEIDKLLGKIADSKIARMLGVTRKTVAYRRKKFRIPASYDLSDMKPPPNMGGWNKMQLPQEIIDNLGRYPDYVLAERIGACKSVIARARRARGIPPYAEATGNNGKFRKGDPHPRWSRNK